VHDSQDLERGREFFTTITVAAALELLAEVPPTDVEPVPLADALGRTPADPLRTPAALPGFARSTVDGFAVRAADTFGASEGLPSYLDLVGAVAMGRPAEVEVRAGTAVAMPTGGVLPDGADAVVMVEHTQQTMPGTVEVTRPAAPGDGTVRADEDVAAGGVLAPPGRPLRAQDLGLLAAAGVVTVPVRRRPRVGIVSTGDEVVPPDTASLAPGQVRDATASALAGLVAAAGGVPVALGIVRDDAPALEATLRDAVTTCDLVVVSAGSSVGARDQTATAVARLGRPGVLCHGLSVRPGKPTLLADCSGTPLIGLPGNPLSALVVFRLLGVPLVHRVGGVTQPPPEPRAAAVLDRQVPSQAGRLDVVQVQLARDGARVVASPVFGASALLSVLTRADGCVVVPEDDTGLPAGAEVEVTLYR
jgi:molybdopterin molybdotransferase